MDRPDVALLERLATPEGRDLLAALPPYDESATLRLTADLRAQGHDADLVSAALTQSRLRAAATARFGARAADLLLTQDGLEQATRPEVSRRRAERFRSSGVDHVLDLGCGLGLDSLALAEAGLRVTAVERDPAVAAAARANLASFPTAQVLVGDATDRGLVPMSGADGVFLDPARRTPGVADRRGRTRRVFRLGDLSPSWDTVLDVSNRVAVSAAKLSPGFPHAHLPSGCEAEWVSLDGSVLECTIWWGAGVRSPGRRAVVGLRPHPGHTDVRWVEVEAPAPAPERIEDKPPGSDAAAEPDLHPYLAEPDRAVLAAGRVDALTSRTGGREVDSGVGYVTAPTVVPLPWARWYAVQDHLPLQAKVVRGWLRERGFTRVTLKKRGVTLDPDRFRTELRLKGGRRGGDQGADPSKEAVLVLTRVAGRPSAIAVQPLQT
ncbi:THUMP-like domain-containing protein [Ornithinimicrobium sp. Y1694]|uniref:THUMP-like domain-containing protein n=1 Tax=Ornithinimicrobium sp. Y1694 TaxID=3418590 RepID=UPI003CF136AE